MALTDGNDIQERKHAAMGHKTHGDVCMGIDDVVEFVAMYTPDPGI